jgi:NAD(P)-dependent dehydrogenase (short-subunit alcohol dehydrogenase family)
MFHLILDLGISLAFARLCVSAGSKVLIADLRLTTEAELFVSQHSKIVEFVKCDVSIWREMEVLGQRAIAAWGDVPDVWVAGAGVFEPVRGKEE